MRPVVILQFVCFLRSLSSPGLHHEKSGRLPLHLPQNVPSSHAHARLPPPKHKHSKQPIKINKKASLNGNGRKVVMTVLHPGSKGSTKSNAAVQLYMKPRVVVNTPKKQNGGGAAVIGDKKPLQKTVKNDKVKGPAAVQARGGVGGGGKAFSNVTSSNKNMAIGTSINNNSSSNTYNTGTKNFTAMATAKLIVSAGSHPKNTDIKQVRFEKGRG